MCLIKGCICWWKEFWFSAKVLDSWCWRNSVVWRKVAILTYNISYLYCTAIQTFTAKTIIVFTWIILKHRMTQSDTLETDKYTSHTNALMNIDVIHKSSITLAFKASWYIHTSPMVAHCWHEMAFVYFFCLISDTILNITRFHLWAST